MCMRYNLIVLLPPWHQAPPHLHDDANEIVYVGPRGFLGVNIESALAPAA